MEELKKVLKELLGFSGPWGEQQCQRPEPLELLGTRPPTRVHMEKPMAPAMCVAVDGLVGHQWEEEALFLWVFDAPV